MVLFLHTHYQRRFIKKDFFRDRQISLDPMMIRKSYKDMGCPDKLTQLFDDIGEEVEQVSSVLFIGGLANHKQVS